MDLNFKNIVTQNSRTIIFERFNDQAPNLCTLLKGQDADEALDKINKELCVNSFKRFREVFKPTVYEIFANDDEGNLKVTYSLEYCKGAHSISLCDHEFYNAVHNIAIEKSASTNNNNEIDYTKLYEALDPARIYTKARRRRDEVRQFVSNAITEQENGNPDGVKKWIRMAKQVHDDVKKEYAGSALRILPLVVRDAEMILEGRGIKSENAGLIGDSGNVPQLRLCSVEWDSDGNLKTVPLKENKTEVLGLEQKEDKILRITQKNWESTVNSIPEGSVDKNLFMSVYSECENTALANLTTEQLIERKQIYGNMYVAAQQSFCNAVGYLVQKVADVEQFFIHAGDDDGIVESGVIIANCSVADVIENKRIVKDFLKTASNNEDDRIWFAVLPSASDSSGKWELELSPGNDVDIDFYDPFDINNVTEENNTDSGVEKVTVSEIGIISEMLAEYGILSFFNFNACEKTSFKCFGANDKIIKEYENEISGIKRTDSVVLAYPNFTIIPKNKRQVEMVNDTKLYTPAVYIDAAYVAAGIVVATQNLKIQKKKFGKKIADEIPFIRFDLEEKENSQMFFTKFNPESRLNMGRDLSTYLKGENGNAFCFRSDSLERNAFVFTARTLNARPVYQFITQKYFSFLLERKYSTGMTNDEANEFVNVIKKIKFNNSDIVNNILYQNEEFIYNEEQKEFSIAFSDGNVTIDIVVKIA